jgi:hypothetical protein
MAFSVSGHCHLKAFQMAPIEMKCDKRKCLTKRISAFSNCHNERSGWMQHWQFVNLSTSPLKEKMNLTWQKSRSFSTSNDLDEKDCSTGYTRLHKEVNRHVILNRYYECQQLLLKGADPNIKDHTGRTPLDSARLNNTPDIEELLLDFGAKTSVYLFILQQIKNDKRQGW